MTYANYDNIHVIPINLRSVPPYWIQIHSLAPCSQNTLSMLEHDLLQQGTQFHTVS